MDGSSKIPKLITNGLVVASSLAIADLVNTVVDTYVPKPNNRVVAKVIYTTAVIAATVLVSKQLQELDTIEPELELE